MPTSTSGFDKLARPYRWLEYLAFGPLLMRTRFAFLPQMTAARRVMLLGDGDGRFCAALLRTNRIVRVDAVDGSSAMLQALCGRAACVGGAGRVTTHLQSVLDPLPNGPFDCVCTHFLLDCLGQEQVVTLAAQVRARMTAGRWVVSEFAIPQGLAKWPARLLVAALYRAFGLLTGLRARRLPQHDVALHAAGFSLVAVQTRLFGILRSELWDLPDISDRPSKLEVR